jgi:hypothetical protein
MRAFYTRRFLHHYAKAPLTIQRAVDRRVALLIQNLRHPSLRAKKYDEAQNIWQARVNGGWRLYYARRSLILLDPKKSHTLNANGPLSG